MTPPSNEFSLPKPSTPLATSVAVDVAASRMNHHLASKLDFRGLIIFSQFMRVLRKELEGILNLTTNLVEDPNPTVVICFHGSTKSECLHCATTEAEKRGEADATGNSDQQL